MTHHTITDLDRITAAIDPIGAIEFFIWDQLTDGCYWESVSQIRNQLESASCANGSWSGMIYTRDILDRLSDSEWVDDIDTAIQEYFNETGETFDFSSLSETVTFAVDWVAQRLASRLRGLDCVAVVIAPVDAMDPNPDVIAFDCGHEAEDWIAEEIQRRVQHQVDHSPYPVTEDEREDWAENEIMLFTLTEDPL